MPLRSTTHRERSPDGSLTASEIDRRGQVWLDDQPIRVSCFHLYAIEDPFA